VRLFSGGRQSPKEMEVSGVLERGLGSCRLGSSGCKRGAFFRFERTQQNKTAKKAPRSFAGRKRFSSSVLLVRRRGRASVRDFADLAHAELSCCRAAARRAGRARGSAAGGITSRAAGRRAHPGIAAGRLARAGRRAGTGRGSRFGSLYLHLVPNFFFQLGSVALQLISLPRVIAQGEVAARSGQATLDRGFIAAAAGLRRRIVTA